VVSDFSESLWQQPIFFKDYSQEGKAEKQLNCTGHTGCMEKFAKSDTVSSANEIIRM
jgi:hypothetical protein